MRSFILLTLVASLALAQPTPEKIIQKRGLLELAHAPTLVHAAPLYDKSYATPIVHAGPVITKVFEAPPVPLVRSYGPIVTGPLITRGIGPHILGSKPILHAPIIGAHAPIYSAPALIAKPIVAHAPVISYAPKVALGHPLW